MQNFSSVVGPNGSGKSNVIDGFLFVCGKRAKKIRLNKISELIHNSGQHRNLEFARVSVHFVAIVDREGADRSAPDAEQYDIVPGSETVVSRVAYKNNTSKYFVDDKVSTYTDVTTRLRQYGIDLDHNRFLILQGEVEQIATMKPKAATEHEDGLLEYLEDIIGSNQYVDAIDEAGVEVEKMNTERTEKLNRVRHVERQKNELESSKIEAELYLNKEAELARAQGVLYQVFRNDARNNVAIYAERATKYEEQLAAEKAKLSEVEDGLKKAEAEYGATKEEHDAVAQQMEKSKADFAVFERKDIKARADIKHLKQKEKKLNEAVKKDKNKRAELDQNVADAEADAAKYEKEVSELEAKKAKEEKALEKILDGLKETTGPLREKLEKKQQELIPFAKDVDEAQSQVDVFASEKKMLEESIAEGDTLIAEVTESLAAAEETLQTRRANVGTLEGDMSEAQMGAAKAKAKLEKLRPEEGQLVDKVKELRGNVESSRASQTSEASRGQVHRCLMEAKKSKKIPGIHGRLGELGRIDDKFDVAISTACPALNHMVVDTTSDGQRAVEYLRKHNMGRATFIILDQLKYLDARMASSAADVPSGSTRLFDLVEPTDDKFSRAFYFALRNTLVAKDLESATKLAYSGRTRHRVVTLDGNLIDTSGTMSGGGNKVARGGMSKAGSSNVTDAEIRQMERELEKATSRLEAVRKQIAECEDELEKSTRRAKEVETAQAKVNMDVQALTEKVATLQERVAELKRQPKKDTKAEQARVAELAKLIGKEEKTLEAAKAKMATMEAEVEKLQKEIMDTGGVKLKVQKQRVDSLTQQIDAAQTAVTKCRVQVKSATTAIGKAEKALAGHEADLAAVRAEAEEKNEAFKQLEEDALAVMESYKATELLLETKAEELKEYEVTFEEQKKVMNKFRTVEIDIANQLEDTNRLRGENADKAEHWSRKFTQLVEQAAGMLLEDEEAKKIPELDTEAVEAVNREDVQQSIGMLEEEMKLLSGSVNMSAIAEYRKREAEYNERVAELDSVTEKRDELRKVYEDLRKKRLDEFMAGFSVITMKLKEMYQMITLGGDAELELVDSLDPFSEGIVFSVRPPKKSWKNITNLSGGEKTLSSLALVFALHHYKPTPLYVMDEIDAALDFKNVSIVANYIKERTADAQFIIISLRNNMFELADRLVGIYKTHDATKSVTIDPNKFKVPQTAALAAPAGSQTPSAADRSLVA